MITVTRFAAADYDRWADLWRQYLAFYQTELPDSQYQYTWKRLHDGRMGGFAARAEGGRIIGITHYLYHEHGWSTSPTCYLQDLFTDPASRGAGVGRALIEAVAAAARTDGASRLYWMTQETNVTAQRLYDTLAKNAGFRIYNYTL